MHHLVLGNYLGAVVAPIFLSVLVLKLLKKRRASEQRNAEDPNPGAPSPSILPMTYDYDVFLSFRGVDTGIGFADLLYDCLGDAGIHVFRYDDELDQGERISTDLLEAITKSKILIPIISQNYASSKRCLDELVQMMECKERLGHIVLPIFYKVEAAEVRYQKGSFGDAFHYHGRRRLNPEVVHKWKKTLVDVSSLKGWESERVADRHEGKLVKLIVQKVLSELKKGTMLSTTTEKLVGIDSHVDKVMELLNKSCGATICVGIHGRGGIGKTTLAKVIYNKLFILFQHHSFIADIRESCMSKGIEYLQNKLISDILEKDNQLHDKDSGINFISSIFKEKKVLIILDDVDMTNQIEALAGNLNWFASGSRIIVTTRDKSVLDRAGVDHTEYEYKEMDEQQSLILFSRHAFRKDSPPSEFFALSHLVVSTIGGFPLYLKVLGSSLYGKTQAIWADALEKMQNSAHRVVRDTLGKSYEALEENTKQIFLDIACFLNGSDARVAYYMWDACGFCPSEGIEVLRYLSFINIGDNHELRMDKQMRDLGREIARGEDHKPQQRSRLWDYDEAMKVLGENKDAKTIQAICLMKGNSTKIANEDDFSCIFTAKQFRNLPNLRFLHMSDANLTGDFKKLFSQLRWLKWGNCPSTFAARNFHAGELVILDLSGSPISDDWGGWRSMTTADKLKVLNLTGCRIMKSNLYLSAFKRLEILILRDCGELEQIDPCIGYVKSLVSLDLSGCSCLKELPHEMGKLELLEELLLDQTMIGEIPSSIGSLTKLKTLSAKDCKSLHLLPDSIYGLVSLSTLVLSGCFKLAALPESIGSIVSLQCLSSEHCHQLREIPDSIEDLKCGCSYLEEPRPQKGKLEQLKELLLDQTLIKEIPSSIGSLKMAETLSARDCKLLSRLPDSIGDLVNLSTLLLSGCVELVALPDSIRFLVSLRCLSLERCHRFREIPNSIGDLKVLTRLDLSGCSCLEELPPQMGKLEQLKELILDQTMIREIPSSIGSLKKLEMLSAKDCKLLRRLPDSMRRLENLLSLDLAGCVELAALPDGIGFLVNLWCLSLGRCHRLREMPNSIGGLKLLTQLDVSGCTCLEELPPRMGKLEQLKELHLDQTMIREIPSSIGSLKKVVVVDQTMLRDIPAFIGSLKQLETLSAKDCKLLCQLPESIGHLVNLSSLVLSGCIELSTLPDSIGFLVNLRRLSLGRCLRLREIPDSLRKLKLLTQLDLSGCSCLQELPPQMGEIEQLKELLLDQTMIQEIPSSIGSLKKLEMLSAKDCKSLRRLPGSMHHLVNLLALDLSGCVELTALPNSIGFLVNLRHLSLGHCRRLREIPNSIGELKLLTQLDLSWTRITKLPESIGDLQNLEFLDIRHSSIENLPGGVGRFKKL